MVKIIYIEILKAEIKVCGIEDICPECIAVTLASYVGHSGQNIYLG